MDEQIRSEIKNGLSLGKTIFEIKANLSQKGYSDLQIDAVFSEMGLEKEERPINADSLPPAVLAHNQPLANKPPDLHHITEDDLDIDKDLDKVNEPKPIISSAYTDKSLDYSPPADDKPVSGFSSVKALLLIGSVLVVLAAVLGVESASGKLTPWARISFVMVPMLILFATAIFAKFRKMVETYNVCLAIGGLLFPSTITLILTETKATSDPNQILLGSFSLAFFLYFIFELILRRWFFSAYAIIAFYITLISIVRMEHWNVYSVLWLAPILAFGLFALGVYLQNKMKKDGNVYALVGLVLFVTNLPLVILAYLNRNNPISLQANVIIFALFGLLYLIIAGILNYFRTETGNNLQYKLKRFLEEVSPFVLIFPFFALASADMAPYRFASSNIHVLPNIIVILVLSLVVILASTKIRIRSFIYAGTVGLIVGTFALTSKYFQASIGWPIALAIIGLLAIWVTLIFQRSSLGSGQQGLIMGLGEDLDLTKKGIRWGFFETFGSISIVNFLTWGIFILVFVILYSSIIYSFLGRRSSGPDIYSGADLDYEYEYDQPITTPTMRRLSPSPRSSSYYNYTPYPSYSQYPGAQMTAASISTASGKITSIDDTKFSISYPANGTTTLYDYKTVPVYNAESDAAHYTQLRVGTSVTVSYYTANNKLIRVFITDHN